MNQGTHLRNHPERSNSLHSRDSVMIQFKKIHLCNPPYKPSEILKNYLILSQGGE